MPDHIPTEYIPTVANHAYRLVYTYRQLAGGRHVYRLLNGPGRDAPLLALVLRCWQPQAGRVVWGWAYQGQWYATAEELIVAVLATKQQAA